MRKLLIDEDPLQCERCNHEIKIGEFVYIIHQKFLCSTCEGMFYNMSAELFANFMLRYMLTSTYWIVPAASSAVEPVVPACQAHDDVIQHHDDPSVSDDPAYP